MPYIPTNPVESSNLERVGYDRKTSTLRIIFHGGRAYDYPMVPEQEFQKLLQAESLGKFFNTRIKPMYAYRTPRPEELEPPVIEVPPAVPRTPEGEIDYEAIPDASHLFKDRDDLLDVPCRCCGKALQVPPEDACDLCVACYQGKGGDTNEQCRAHLDRRDDCPHGADGRDCEESCTCGCHAQHVQAPGGVRPMDWKPIDPHEHPQLESEPED